MRSGRAIALGLVLIDFENLFLTRLPIITSACREAMEQRRLQRPLCLYRTGGQLSCRCVRPARYAGQCGRVDTGLLERKLQQCAERWTRMNDRRLFHARDAWRRVGRRTCRAAFRAPCRQSVVSQFGCNRIKMSISILGYTDSYA